MASHSIGELAAAVLAKHDECDRIKKDLDAAGEECTLLEAELSDAMIAQGIQLVKADDGRTLYKCRELYVSVEAANREAVVAACKLLGLDDLIRTEVPTSQLKAHIREWLGEIGDHDQIPEQLRPLVKVFEKYLIRVRKS